MFLNSGNDYTIIVVMDFVLFMKLKLFMLINNYKRSIYKISVIKLLLKKKYLIFFRNYTLRIQLKV